jgi:uncharacterized protein
MYSCQVREDAGLKHMPCSPNVIISAPDGTTLVENAEWAGTFLKRCMGLLGRAAPGRGCGLLLAPCRAVHTCFMRFSLDLFFFSRDYHVVRAVRNVGPWRFVYGGRRAWGVLEVQAGHGPRERVGEGDRLVLTVPGEENG